MSPSIPSIERWTIAASLALLVAMLCGAALHGAHLPVFATVAVVIVLFAAITRLSVKRLPENWDGIARRRPLLSAFWLLLLVAMLARTAGLAMFMADASHSTLSTFGFDPFYIGHSCYSGYWHAANLASDGAQNLYAIEHYQGKTHGIFRYDEFLYLPQFLLLPLSAVTLGADFDQTRALWFGVEGIGLLACLVFMATWIGGQPGRRVALLIPAIWIATPVLLTLQLGNFHLTAVTISAAAMALFWKDRPMLGGALLGFAVFKLFPGILGIYLIATRRWKAVGWTLTFSMIYTIATYAWIGQAPFQALFDYNLPRIANGEIWAFLEIPDLDFVAAINDSIPGVVYKLKALGVSFATRELMLQLSWIWTLVVVGLTVLSALRASRMSRIELAANWFALLALAAARSPFLPDHTGLFAPLCVWALVAAGSTVKGGRIGLHVFAWIALAAVLPFTGTMLDDGMDRFVVSGISQIVATGLCLWVVLRKPASTRTPHEDPLSLPTPFTSVA